MIAFVTGSIAEKGASHCVLDVGGVGLRLAMSTGSLAALPSEGDTVTVFTHLHVREDELSLFGFESAKEQALFRKLITVSGVGPKVALAALSSYEADVLASAIASGDVAVVSSIPGIGKKTAQRIILELKEKLGGADIPGIRTGLSADTLAEAREALLGMGFSSAEIASALKGVPSDRSASLIVKEALRRLGGGGR